MAEEAMQSATMDRREAIRRLAVGTAATAAIPAATTAGHAPGKPGEATPVMPMASPEGLGCAQPADPSLTSPTWKPKFFDDHQNATIVELSDLIIPETDTPGAKAVKVNRFIDLLLNDSPPEAQKHFIEALGQLDGYCVDQHGKAFLRLSASDQQAVLTVLTHSSSDPEVAKKVESFRTVKATIVRAYYSSEIGLVQELKYQTNPFQPDLPGCSDSGEHS